MIVGAQESTPSNRVLCWLVDSSKGVARYNDMPLSGIAKNAGAMHSCVAMLERCGWVEVREPRNYASDRQRKARGTTTVHVTPAGRLWRAYLRHHRERPMSLMQLFAYTKALEDAVRPLVLLGKEARKMGLEPTDLIKTELPASAALAAAEIIAPPGSRPTIYPWTPGRLRLKEKVLGNRAPVGSR